MTRSDSVREFRRRYVMATTATHKLGDLSREEPDLALVYDETARDWIGRWVEGFGFFDVRFPKVTSRELTAAEIAQYDGAVVALNGDPMARITLGAGGTKRV